MFRNEWKCYMRGTSHAIWEKGEGESGNLSEGYLGRKF